MPNPKAEPIILGYIEKEILTKIANSRTKPASIVKRANIILYADQGKTNTSISKIVSLTIKIVSNWRKKWKLSQSMFKKIEETAKHPKELNDFVEQILKDNPRPGTPARITQEQRVQILSLACENPKKSGLPLSHWTIQELVYEIKKRKIVEEISWTRVQNFLKSGALKPHQSRYWLNPNIENREDFVKEVNNVCSLYEDVPKLHEEGTHTISVDEMTCIQALEHAKSPFPMKPGQVERIEFEYIRHGTTTLIGNFDVATGKMVSPFLNATRTEKDFVKNIKNVISTDPTGRWIFICDQLNIHKSESLVKFIAEECDLNVNLGKKGKEGILQSMKSRKEFLENLEHRIRFVYTPKHTSWLNQIEIWFGILQKKLVNRRSSFTSINDLETQILKFIEYYNIRAKPFKWTYRGMLLED